MNSFFKRHGILKKGLVFGLVLLLALASVLPGPAVHAKKNFSFRQYFKDYDDVRQMLIGNPETGEVYYEKDGKSPNAIASMTKIMTYYLVKDAISQGEISGKDKVKVSEEAAALNNPDSSNYGLEEGDKFTVDRLLKGLMVVSGNDAALALAEHVSGSEEDFVQAMNQKAKEFGMEDSHFVNPSGLTEEDGSYNVSSPRDMFILARAVLKDYPEIVQYASIKSLDEPGRNYYHLAVNEIEGMTKLPGFLGLKSGFTDEAGSCYTGYFRVKVDLDGQEYPIVTVVMGAKDPGVRYRVNQQMVDLVGGSLIKRTLLDKNISCGWREVRNSKEGFVKLFPAENCIRAAFEQTPFQVQYEINEPILAPTKKGEVLGKAQIYFDGDLVQSVDIVGEEATSSLNGFGQFQKAVTDLLDFFFSAL